MKEQEHFIATAERLNKVRLARALAMLTPLQRHLMQLIPVLFHYHRNDFPGYNGPMTPSGVFEYFPSDDALEACRTLGLSEPQVIHQQQSALYGVYTMGSTASFGQNPKSDIDVWLVYDPTLADDEIASLQDKSQLLTAWFGKYDLEVNIYLVHPKQFISSSSDGVVQTASLGCENSGSVQHWLLLEEFYRSQICLGGKRVAWWPGAEAIESHLFLGDVSNLPASEYFGASLWQLYKGLDKPHKALLKVMLLEAYASDYPNSNLVTTQVWQRTLAGDFSAFNDAYFLLYQSIEHYLEYKNDKRRLEIVRRCFYLKCGIRLTVAEHPKDWRYYKLQSLVTRWGWSDNLLRTLDQCASWHCGQLQWFNEQLNELMLGCYQTLLQFASANKLSDSLNISELGLLTRKLHTYFSEDDKQIISLNRLWTRSVAEAHLTVIYSHNTKEYYLYRCTPESKNFMGNRAVFHSHSKAKLLIWASLNGVSTAQTQWYAYGEGKGQDKALTKAAKRLPTIMAERRWRASKLDLCQPWHFRQLLFLINFNRDETQLWRGQEIIFDYMNANIFSMGRHHRNMVQSLDVICQNSWGEWHCHHFEGNEAILDALVYITPGMQRAPQQVKVDVVSCSSRLSTQIERSISQLVHRANRMCTKAKTSSTMVHPLQVGGIKYGLFFNSKGMVYQDLSESTAFYQRLSKQRMLELPRPDLGNEPFSKIPEVIQDFAAIGAIQYFLRPGKEGIDVFVLDEKNELNHYVQPGNNLEELVSQVSHHHAFADSYLDNERFNLPQFFRLVRVDGRLQAQPFGVNVDEAAIEF
ncbi:class I adenylate cyclase [Shewanella rhizosphaerae]|uniref:class I adenylate cyclase n=1 Tax=Shewanella rhizosphaerae TaxID=2864207 RepID=UPI001C661E15|nr:class I adenylate cyclase [Shewanella rhizosphaerae]QYK13247.1 class I adenylate cyclase [Shewanella rhizosphaerae]